MKLRAFSPQPPTTPLLKTQILQKKKNEVHYVTSRKKFEQSPPCHFHGRVNAEIFFLAIARRHFHWCLIKATSSLLEERKNLRCEWNIRILFADFSEGRWQRSARRKAAPSTVPSGDVCRASSRSTPWKFYWYYLYHKSFLARRTFGYSLSQIYCNNSK